ncbi:MAG TPA: DinB family protein [Gemmatimonadaceae bacterium]
MSTTSDLAQAFIDESRRYLSAEYLPKIRACLEQLSDEAIWWRANEASNSIGNLVLHLAGNVRQWIASGVGGAPDIRDRPQEFAQREPIAGTELLSRLTEAVGAADATLARLSPDALREHRTIQGTSTTVYMAIYHVVEHFSTHTGQIILITKMHPEARVQFYQLVDGVAHPRW